MSKLPLHMPHYRPGPGAVRFIFILLLLSALLPCDARAVRLTNVKHLFDITHHFRQPSDISVAKNGLVYVVDGVNNQIKVFDQNGKYSFAFGTRGSLKGQFKFPLGIDIGNSGKIYIADTGNHRVQIFSPEGKYIDQIKIPSKIRPADPSDVAVDESSHRLYVADNDNHYILVYDLSTMGLSNTFGTPGSEEREFRYPFLMSLDREKYLYVSDVVNTRVQVFNSDGLFVNVVGGWGVEKGRFFRPKGIAVDRNKRVFVSDSYMGVIQVFRSTGGFYSVIGESGNNSVKKFITPTGLYIDGNNRLYVVEMFAERVSVYSIESDSE